MTQHQVDLRAVRESILPLMALINERVPVGFVITLVARNTEYTNCDVVLTQEKTLEEAIKAIRGIIDTQPAAKAPTSLIMTGL